jgi:hypothetical protein
MGLLGETCAHFRLKRPEHSGTGPRVGSSDSTPQRINGTYSLLHHCVKEPNPPAQIRIDNRGFAALHGRQALPQCVIRLGRTVNPKTDSPKRLDKFRINCIAAILLAAFLGGAGEGGQREALHSGPCALLSNTPFWPGWCHNLSLIGHKSASFEFDDAPSTEAGRGQRDARFWLENVKKQRTTMSKNNDVGTSPEPSRPGLTA